MNNKQRLEKIGRCGERVKKNKPGTSKESAMKICSKAVGEIKKGK